MAETIIAEDTGTRPTDEIHYHYPFYAAFAARQRKLWMRYWTTAQQMRLRGELPAWVRDNFPSFGGEDDYEEYRVVAQTARRCAVGMRESPRYFLNTDYYPTLSASVIEREDHRVVFSGRALDAPLHFNVEELMPVQLAALARRVKKEIEGERTKLRLRERRVDRKATRYSEALQRLRRLRLAQQRRRKAA